MRTKFVFKKFKKILENKRYYLNIYVKVVILTPKNSNTNHLKQNVSDFEIRLARKIRTDVFSLYRNMDSLGTPENICTK